MSRKTIRNRGLTLTPTAKDCFMGAERKCGGLLSAGVCGGPGRDTVTRAAKMVPGHCRCRQTMLVAV